MAETTPKTVLTGKCALCGSVLPKSRMTVHLKTCVPEHDAQLKASKPKASEIALIHFLVEGEGMPMYWLHLDMPGTARLKTLDQFLRDIWLECCGHLSQFTIEGVYYVSDRDPFEDDIETHTMTARLIDVLEPGMVFRHEYDFGTSTYLTLSMQAVRPGLSRRSPVRLLARNTPPDRPCAVCGKPAEVVCSMCVYGDDPAWYCAEHQSRHLCPDVYHEEYFLPAANSPRVGMCGYTG
jgi:hypothetical protein